MRNEALDLVRLLFVVNGRDAEVFGVCNGDSGTALFVRLGTRIGYLYKKKYTRLVKYDIIIFKNKNCALVDLISGLIKVRE